MIKISAKTIEKAVYELCFNACTMLNDRVYSNLYTLFENASVEEKKFLKSIIENAKIAHEKRLPLCQDTGQTIVFAQIGQNVHIEGGLIDDAINSGIKKSYEENFFRKSVVKNSVFDRTNTKDNTPGIIYVKQIPGDEIKLSVLIKGAGSENKSKLEMMLPTASREEIIEKCSEMILEAGENSCPPMFIGFGIGATADKAFVMSKEAFISENFTVEEKELAEEIKKKVNENAPDSYKTSYVAEVRIKTCPTHIACMPVALTVNCHSDRYSKCIIGENDIKFLHEKPEFHDTEVSCENNKELKTSDIDEIKNLKRGENILLTGEIYVARDAAHERISRLMKENKPLPFDLKDKIIFYAGPCPAKPGEITGSIGPTTASRTDKYCEEFYSKGIIATIGKGTRSESAEDAIKKYGGKYLTAQGGIAALLAQKIKKSEIIAFEDLGPEAVYKLYVEKFPVKVVI